VISDSDAHSTTGTLVFSIGTGIQPTGSTTSEASPKPPWWRVGLRWLNLLSLLIVTGGVAFAVFVARPLATSVENQTRLTKAWRPVRRGAVVIAVVGHVAALHNQTVVAANLGFAALPSLETYRRRRSRTRRTRRSRLSELD